jgi:hypothetical protein
LREGHRQNTFMFDADHRLCQQDTRAAGNPMPLWPALSLLSTGTQVPLRAVIGAGTDQFSAGDDGDDLVSHMTSGCRLSKTSREIFNAATEKVSWKVSARDQDA